MQAKPNEDTALSSRTLDRIDKEDSSVKKSDTDMAKPDREKNLIGKTDAKWTYSGTDIADSSRVKPQVEKLESVLARDLRNNGKSECKESITGNDNLSLCHRTVRACERGPSTGPGGVGHGMGDESLCIYSFS